MLKDYLKVKNVSTYKVAQLSGIPYSTLNDIVNCKIDISNIRAGILFKLANILNLSMDELYKMCSNEINIYSDKYDIKGTVVIKNKQYVLEFLYHDKEYTEEVCPVKKEATMFITTIAKWQMEKIISKAEMEEIYELCIKEKR